MRENKAVFFFSKASHPRAAHNRNRGSQIWWGLSRGVGQPRQARALPAALDVGPSERVWQELQQDRMVLHGMVTHRSLALGMCWQHPRNLGALKSSLALSHNCSLRGSVKSLWSPRSADRVSVAICGGSFFSCLKALNCFSYKKKKEKKPREREEKKLLTIWL